MHITNELSQEIQGEVADAIAHAVKAYCTKKSEENLAFDVRDITAEAAMGMLQVVSAMFMSILCVEDGASAEKAYLQELNRLSGGKITIIEADGDSA